MSRIQPKAYRLVFGLFMFSLLMVTMSLQQTNISAQIPTGAIPTVTGTELGVFATANILSGEGVKVRGGPNALFYPEVGFMIVGQSAPALGISPGGNWILIDYPGAPGNRGWVFKTYVNLSEEGLLPVVAPPASPTPEVTSTINPTLEAQFIITETATTMPTFTAAPPIQIPTYTENTGGILNRIPMGLLIVVLLISGILLGVFSMVRRR